MNGWFWFWAISCVVFWIAFILLYRSTKKMGINPWSLVVFWFTLVSVSFLTISIIILALTGSYRSS